MRNSLKKATALLLALMMAALALASCKGGEGAVSDTAPTVQNGGEQGSPDTEHDVNKRAEVLATMDNDFQSRTKNSYANINGKTVDVYSFYREQGEAPNNPNFGVAVMLAQCIKYKQNHPEEKVTMTFASFHISVRAAACLDRDSEEYGMMKNLYDGQLYDDKGYVCISYLLVEAARHGIETVVNGHLNAAPIYRDDGTTVEDLYFDRFFNEYLDDDSLIEGKKIGDFMNFTKTNWTSYGDKAAADMMHLKAASVSHYTDSEGVDHGPAVWLGSTNLDGIKDSGSNWNDNIQTGVIITDHDMIYRTLYNYMMLLSGHGEKEQASEFRNKAMRLAAEQIALINAGKGDEIPEDKRIVYLGTENDKVFELYFTPFGTTQSTWDTVNNPFCKYINMLRPEISGESYIELLWNNPKFKMNFALGDTIVEMIVNAFLKNKSGENRLHICMDGIDVGAFDKLQEGYNIAHKFLNDYSIPYHIKDLQLSYATGGERHYVTVYNTLNFHEGSMSYQSNSVLIIHETDKTGNGFYTDYAIMTTPEIDFESRRVSAK